MGRLIIRRHRDEFRPYKVAPRLDIDISGPHEIVARADPDEHVHYRGGVDVRHAGLDLDEVVGRAE